MSKRKVVVSGIGAVTPFGVGVNTFWENVVKGKSAARLITSFDVSCLPTKFGAQVPLNDRELESCIENQKSIKTMSRAGKFAIIASDEAMNDSHLNTNTLNPYRFGTSIGSGGLGFSDTEHAAHSLQILLKSIEIENGKTKLNNAIAWENTLKYTHPLTPLKALPNIPTAHIAIIHNARGHCQTISTACTSSTQAIGEAYRQIKFGIADVVIAGGNDSMINPHGLIAFSTLGVLSKNNAEYETASRPFDRRRDGFMIGEGAAMFILEELEHCKRRNATPYCELIGYASTCDAFRLTDEPPEAWGSIEAMKLAIEDACIKPDEIDYINAHGTGTQMNDKTESHAMKTILQNCKRVPPVSSTKSMIGHCVAAAGAIEFVACVLAMQHQTIPPTINYQEPDPECDLDYVPNIARNAKLHVVMSNSFGFGGQNACLIIRKI